MFKPEQVIVAFDTNDLDQLKNWSNQLSGVAKTIKIGMELYLSQGPQIIDLLKKNDFDIFLDLKLHDIPNTVSKTCSALASLGVDILNVHAAGGIEMMSKAKEELAKKNSKTKLIAVTQLTSTDLKTLNNEIAIPLSIEQAVIHYAKMTKEAGLDGVVASAHEVIKIKEICGDHFITVTPGIRPQGTDHGDQKRVMTPSEAFTTGTDYIVIGRPITEASDPTQAFKKILG